ncbi:Phosphoglucomutase-2 [Gurleya vavrai]
MDEKEKNEILRITYQYLKIEKNTEFKQIINKKIKNEDYDYLKNCMCKNNQFKDGAMVSKIGPGWSQINDTSIGIIAKSCASILTQKCWYIAKEHPKNFLTSDPVPIQKYIFIAYDTRKDSKKFAFVFAEAFYAFDYFIHMPEEPCLASFTSYMAGNSFYKYGIYITGHPKSKDYNGVIIYLDDGCKITKKFYDLINNEIKLKKVFDIKNDFKIDFINIDEHLNRFVKHFLYGTGCAMDQLYKNVQFKKEKRIIISCMYGPAKKALEIAIDVYGLKGIFCFYKPHLIYDFNLGNQEDLNPNENFLEKGLLDYADYYKSEYIFLFNAIGTQFRIAAKQFNNWKLYSVDDIVSVFLDLYYKNASPLDTIVINNSNCTNLGAFMSMKYGFRYAKPIINSENVQSLFCKYKKFDKQINNFFVYNENFEFSIYYGMEPSCVHMAIIASTIIQYEMPDVIIQKIKNIFGEFAVVKRKLMVKFNTLFLKIRDVIKSSHIITFIDEKSFGFAPEKYVYIFLYENSGESFLIVYFNQYLYNNLENYVDTLIDNLIIKKK